MCGGRCSISRRSFIRVSPVRTAVRISGISRPRSAASARISLSGPSRFFWMSLPSAFSGETYRTSVRSCSVAVQRLAHQAVDADEKRRQRFAGAGGRGDQRGAAGENLGPALLLRLGGRAELREEPLRNQRMRPRKADREWSWEASGDFSRVSLFFRWEEKLSAACCQLSVSTSDKVGSNWQAIANGCAARMMLWRFPHNLK